MIQFLSVIKWISAMSKDADLNAGALRTAIQLAESMNRKTGECRPGRSYLAEQTNQSERSVQRAIQLLIRTGWISVSESKTGRGNRAQFTLINRDESVSLNGQIKGDNLDPLYDHEKGDSYDSFYDGEKGDNPVSHKIRKGRQPCPERETSLSIKGDKTCTTSKEENRGIEPGYRTGGSRERGDRKERSRQKNNAQTRWPIPPDFSVTNSHRDYAKIHMLPDPDECLLVFVNHHQSRGTLSANWDAEFRKWLVNEKRFKRPRNATHSTTDSYTDRLDRAEAIVLQKATERSDSGNQATVCGDEEQLPAPLEPAVQGRSGNG